MYGIIHFFLLAILRHMSQFLSPAYLHKFVVVLNIPLCGCVNVICVKTYQATTEVVDIVSSHLGTGQTL